MKTGFSPCFLTLRNMMDKKTIWNLLGFIYYQKYSMQEELSGCFMA